MGGRSEWIGFRVACWRDVAGMTQQELADRVQISREHLSRIENGHKAVTTGGCSTLWRPPSG